jgi:Zn-dependent protease
LGRITLNPVSHTDPIGTLLIPIVMFVVGHTGGALASIPLIGWGKPTPVNPLRWRNKDLANVMVSIAGILANILIALIAFTILKVLFMMGIRLSESFEEPLGLLLSYMLIMNISLAIFNLLPFPPLDGSKVLDTFLPASMRPAMEILERYGFIILLFLIWIGFFRAIITPVLRVVEYFLRLGNPPYFGP